MIGQLSNPWWVFILLGIGAGVISGALGLGSGTVLIPTLVLLCGCGQKSAQGTALAVMVPMALVGALRYWKNPEIEMNAVIIALIVFGALAGALVGTELVGRLPSHILRKVFAAVLVIAAVRMFMTTTRPKQTSGYNDLTKQEIADSVENGGINSEPEN
ncbi:MAG: sulfite exporter TauE/SafE family protein [Planctomycetota bacterium]|jgi:uncharacterized membrane protein YfcA